MIVLLCKSSGRGSSSKHPVCCRKRAFLQLNHAWLLQWPGLEVVAVAPMPLLFLYNAAQRFISATGIHDSLHSRQASAQVKSYSVHSNLSGIFKTCCNITRINISHYSFIAYWIRLSFSAKTKVSSHFL